MLDLNPAYGGLSMTWDSVKQMIQEKFPDDPKISTTDLSALLLLPENQQPLILDAREKKEYVVSHIYGARIARNKKEAFWALRDINFEVKKDLQMPITWKGQFLNGATKDTRCIAGTRR